MATTLAPVENREVVRCDHCHLVQFRTVNNLCRKCRTSLDEDDPEPILAPPLPVMEPASSSRSEVQVAIAIRGLRQRSGLSQRQLALRMGVPRTYVSKIENEKATPTLSSLSRLAEALMVSVPELLSACTPSRESEINELLSDPFIAELATFTKQLDAIQRVGADPGHGRPSAPRRVDLIPLGDPYPFFWDRWGSGWPWETP